MSLDVILRDTWALGILEPLVAPWAWLSGAPRGSGKNGEPPVSALVVSCTGDGGVPAACVVGEIAFAESDVFGRDFD